jgi:hypothetical protein
MVDDTGHLVAHSVGMWQRQKMVQTWLDRPQWEPVRAPRTNSVTNRSPAEYLAVVQQFDVVNANRYRPLLARTWCKTFVWDVLSAMGCGGVASHWVDSNTGKPGRPFSFGVHETQANDVVSRMSLSDYGWDCLTFEEAKNQADIGCPTIVGWHSKGVTSGHVAVMLPGGNIAQAGVVNFFDKPLKFGFGVRAVQFFSHV